MAGFEMNLEEARELFRQAGVDVGGRALFDVAVAANGPILSIVTVDRNNEIWLWTNQNPEEWKRLPRVPFMVEQGESKPPALAAEGD